MSVLLLHGSGWDEFLLMGGAILLAFIVVKLTTRGASDDEAEEVDPDAAEPAAAEQVGVDR